MRTPELLLQTLIWLPTLIAFARGCAYRWLIPLICGGIAAIDLYDVPSLLSTHNARHSIYLFAGEVVVWMAIFILSICARTSAKARESA
ncbi:MAG: hypothetical protein ACKN9W_16035 [Methylococcus sp.]